MFGDEPRAPYERPALSKEFLAGGAKASSCARARHWEEREIELQLGRRVERLDLGRRTVAGGPPADALVIATGARARALPGARPPAC